LESWKLLFNHNKVNVIETLDWLIKGL